MTALPTGDDCRYCVDGNMPAGTHDILHEVYRPCPVCLHVCWLCEGDGLFPADYTCIPCLIIRLAHLGLAPILCAHCKGVVDLIPTTTNPTREVNPHAHDKD